MSDLYFLTAPKGQGGLLQFLSAVEARLRRPEVPARILLSEAYDHVGGLAAELWDEVRIHQHPQGLSSTDRWTRPRRELSFVRWGRRIQRIAGERAPRRLLVGLDRRISRQLYWSLGPEEYVILDDGIRTEELAARRARALCRGERFPAALRAFDRITGQSRAYVPAVTHFTAFSPEVTPNDCEQRHRFDALTAHFTEEAAVESGVALVVGARLADMTAGTAPAIECVREVVAQLQGDGFTSVRFAPHPSERGVDWPFEQSEIVASELPLELHLLRSAVLPTKVLAFPSSAVVTLDLLLPVSIPIEVIPRCSQIADSALEARDLAALRRRTSQRVQYRMDWTP